MPRAAYPVAAVALIALAAGGFFLYRGLRDTGTPVAAPVPAPARTREAVEVPAVRFTDVTESAGVRFRHFTAAEGLKLLPETMGGGVAVLDYDGDGRPDLFFPNSRPWPGAKPDGPPPTAGLYRNLGGMKFEDVTAAAGLAVPVFGMGVAVGDFDNDGRPDLFVSGVGKHRLFRNVDGKRFADVTEAAGVGGGPDLPGVSAAEFAAWKPPIPFGSSCTFLDYDRDGRLDLFVCHYVTWSPAIDRSVGSTLEGLARAYVQPREFEGAYCGLYRNLGGGKFADVSEAAGVAVADKEGTGPTARRRPVAKALGVVACDPDGDGWPDLLVANDTVRNFLLANRPGPDGGRRFEEAGYAAGAAYADEGRPRGGMGVDWAEYAPGRPAAVVANFANEPVTLLGLEGTKPVRFTDAALRAGLAGPTRAALKFGAVFLDYDLDGRPDLLLCNGHIEPEIGRVQASQKHAQPAQLYWNTGRPDCPFEPVTADRAGPDLFAPLVGRGCATADLDGDGDLDVILAANGGPARVLRNDLPPGPRWVRLALHGDGKAANRSALGASVEVEAGGVVTRWFVAGARGYLSQPELELTVGLGGATAADRVTVRWPDAAGTTETWRGLAAGQTHALRQGEAPGK